MLANRSKSVLFLYIWNAPLDCSNNHSNPSKKSCSRGSKPCTCKVRRLADQESSLPCFSMPLSELHLCQVFGALCWVLKLGIFLAATSYLLAVGQSARKKSVICAYAKGYSCARLDAILLYHDMTSMDTIHLVDKLFLRVAPQRIAGQSPCCFRWRCVVSERIEL
jgi:hypothetical protein